MKTNNGTKEYGLQWRQWGNTDRLQSKEKFFSTDEQRRKFIDKLERTGNLYEVIAYSDPHPSSK